MLEVESLEVFYGDMAALRGVSLRVERGEIVTVLGSNGAGKSTLMKAVAGLLTPRAGTIRLDGEVINGRSPEDLVRRGLAYVPEGREIFPNLSVRDNLLAGALHRTRPARQQALDLVVELFPVLGQRMTQKAGTMSGGEQQMVAIGRALMGSPRLALIDEMSLGVAPIVVVRLFQVVADLRSQGTTLVLVEQNARDALAVADRGYVLETGAVALSGTARELLENRRIRAAYLGLGVEDVPEPARGAGTEREE
jgi:branched-chain amino acid transport system ATP-binding protein